MPAGVAIVVVNYNSGEFLTGCIESLAPPCQNGIAADIVVVDCASPFDQDAHLEAATARGARIVRLPRNAGYAGGCNHGLAATDARYVFFLNADVKACPGAIPALRDHLVERGDVGLAEPRCYVDDARAWKQPSFRPPTPLRLAAALACRSSSRLVRAAERRELRRQVASWQATEPRDCEALSGAFLAARREVMDRVGGFDEGYPLAYEDTDLFARVRHLGLRLTMLPAAEAIHYAHRSRVTVLDEALAKDAIGRQRYLRSHHGPIAVWLDRLGRSRPAPTSAAADLGTSVAPLQLVLGGAPGPFVLQLAYDPAFSVYAGYLGSGASYTFAEASWLSLLATTIHVRAFALPDLSPRGAWTFRRAAAPL